MKNLAISSAVLGLALAANVQASSFSGLYAGADLGNNTALATASPDLNNAYLGLKMGYGWDVAGLTLGGEAFYDGHTQSYTGQDAGLDARLGLPLNRWLPYVKLGVIGTNPGNRTHAGFGVTYSLADHWALNADFNTDKANFNNSTTINNNFSLGIHYYFGGVSHHAAAPIIAEPTPVADAPAPVVEAAPVVVAAPVIVQAAPAPVVAPAPVIVAPVVAEKAAPAPVVTAVVVPAPVATPVVAPVAPAFKTVVVDKPLTLEGTSFSSGSATLNPTAHVQLDQVIALANKNKDASFTISGFTDNLGNAQKNLALSAARAEAVKNYLVKKGVAAERLSTKGVGSANPVADNKTAAGRAKNRRIEISTVLHETKTIQIQ